MADNFSYHLNHQHELYLERPAALFFWVWIIHMRSNVLLCKVGFRGGEKVGVIYSDFFASNISTKGSKYWNPGIFLFIDLRGFKGHNDSCWESQIMFVHLFSTFLWNSGCWGAWTLSMETASNIRGQQVPFVAQSFVQKRVLVGNTFSQTLWWDQGQPHLEASSSHIFWSNTWCLKRLDVCTMSNSIPTDTISV